MKKELKIFAVFVGIFLVAYFLPLSSPKIRAAIQGAFELLQWYVRNHTLPCVVPALFIAGAITTFLSQASVLKYLGPTSNKFLAYSVASVAGTILAVCSCSVLPMFAGIYQLGAGLGPASAFLYSGPAINVLAIFLTARVLGLEIGLARVVGAVAFAFLIGLLMAIAFRKEEKAKAAAAMQLPLPSAPSRPLWKNILYFVCMILVLIFSDWAAPNDVVLTLADGSRVEAITLQETRDTMVFQVKEDFRAAKAREQVTLTKDEIKNIERPDSWVIRVLNVKWYLAGAMGLLLLLMLWRWFTKDEVKEWLTNTWDFAKTLVPLLFGGVFVTGFITVLLPQEYVAGLVGDNSLQSNLVASVVGAFWYFATLTEIPITQALMGLGMHKGPVLALLLAGPALSLPSILVIGKVIGWKKTAVFCVGVVVVATLAGWGFGALAA